jgi:hypothetical protein
MSQRSGPDRARSPILHRGYRMSVAGTPGNGWSVTIHPPAGGRRRAVRLRNRVPHGLEELLAEARRRIDRELDGTIWQREP